MLVSICYLIFSVYLMYCGYIAKKLVDDNNLIDPESKIPTDKLFLSQMIIGLLLLIYSIYTIYDLLGN
jgi:hypothetical protein